MMPYGQPQTQNPMVPSSGGPTQGIQLHPAVAQAFRQRLMGGRPTGAPGGGGIVQPGPKQHNFDEPPSPMGNYGTGGTGPAPAPTPAWNNPHEIPWQVAQPGPNLVGLTQGPNDGPVDNWNHGGGPLPLGPFNKPPNIIPPNGPDMNGPNGRWFSQGPDPMAFATPGGITPANGPGMGGPNGRWSQDGSDPMGAQGMRDRSGPWSRRLGEAPQGPQGWQW